MSVLARSIFMMGLFTGAASTAVAGQFTFTDINDPMSTESNSTEFNFAYGINIEGEIVGSYSFLGGSAGGFVYSAGTFTTLSDPALDGAPVFPSGINDAGQIVGIYSTITGSTSVQYGFLDTGGNFTTIDDPLGVGGTYPVGINDAGQVVGFYYDANSVQHGFLYSDGNFTDLSGPPGAQEVIPVGINNNGEIVGTYTANGQSYAFLDSGGVFTTITDPLPGPPTGINDAGEIVGSYSVSSQNPYGFPQSSVSYGYVDIGGVISTFSDPSASETFHNGYTSGTEAFGINDAGQVVGQYYYFLQNGELESSGFLATPTAASPEPNTIGTMLASILGLTAFALRKRSSH